jgi:diguanylate cyclase (GGDEF)-like protein
MIDQLTGLIVREEFERRFSMHIEKARELDQELSLIVLDIDSFKKVNDRHGHTFGDAVIRKLASIVMKETGDNAVSSRYGGEEFAVLFPATEREQAFLMAEDIRKTMEGNRDFGDIADDLKIRITVSAGVAAFPVDGHSESEVMRKADQALYKAKKTGRNKVCIAQEEKMSTKTTHYTLTQLERLAKLAREDNVGEAVLLREALDDLLIKYKVSRVES